MTRRLDTLLLGVAVGVLTTAGAVAQVQNPPSGIYQPKTQAQQRPLRVEVIDGMRFRDIETRTVYTLYGIDTCGADQSAHLGRQSWPCGVMAVAWLVSATLNTWLACDSVRTDGDVHFVRCASAGHSDLAADMLRDGVAVLRPAAPGDPQIPAYAKAQADARKAYRGLWSSTFQMPADRQQANVDNGEKR